MTNRAFKPNTQAWHCTEEGHCFQSNFKRGVSVQLVGLPDLRGDSLGCHINVDD